MSEIVSILESSDPNFATLIDPLIEKCKVNPIYAFRFNEYYKETSKDDFINRSIVFIVNKQPVASFIYTLNQNPKDEECKISYYGFPAKLLAVPNLDKEVIDSCVRKMLQSLNDSGVKVKNGRIFESFKISINPDLITSLVLEKVLFYRTKISCNFNRVLLLNRNMDDIRKKYSKSVSSVISKNILDFVLTDATQPESVIHRELNNLRFLHFKSSGKLTRSDKSWDLQFKMIKSGDAFLVSGYKQGIIKTSAFFMKNHSELYYGVSASDKEKSDDSLSHQVLDFAIQNAKLNEFQSLWLGTQYSHLNQVTTEKLKNIEKFKSFFGGVLQMELTAESLP